MLILVLIAQFERTICVGAALALVAGGLSFVLLKRPRNRCERRRP